jgi:hypothetical protein
MATLWALLVNQDLGIQERFSSVSPSAPGCSEIFDWLPGSTVCPYQKSVHSASDSEDSAGCMPAGAASSRPQSSMAEVCTCKDGAVEA